MFGLFKRKPAGAMQPRTQSDEDLPMTQAAATADHPVFDRIRTEIDEQDVVLFMKGTPVFPQCGFSAAVVQILSHIGVKFKSVDVLSDMEIREGIKAYSNWPTIPQLYVKGEFVGGCDIITEMTLSGELDQLFDKEGVAYDKDAADKIREHNSE